MLQASLCDGACSSFRAAQAHRFKTPGHRGSLRLRLICSSEDRGGARPGFPTTKVKFVLRKECMFGEHFKVIGGHSTLGEWDPEAAVPLEWSEGHNWTAELEVPQGEKYEYKFVLKSNDGAIYWQPGPNRVFSTLRKPSSLVVAEGWDFDQTCTVAKEEQEYVSTTEENELPGTEDPDGETFLTVDEQGREYVSTEQNGQLLRECESTEEPAGLVVDKQEREYVSTEQNGHLRECESTEEQAVLVVDKQELPSTEEKQECGSAVKPENEEAGGVSSQDVEDKQEDIHETTQEISDQPVSFQHEQHSFCQNEDSNIQSLQDEQHQADIQASYSTENALQDSTSSTFDGASSQIREQEASKDKAVETDPPQPASLTLWKKDRDWFAKVITAIASFFKR